MNTNNNPSKARVKLDEIVKSLFTVSRKVLILLMNGLFNENYDIESTEITIGNNEFISNNFDTITGDLFVKILEENKKPFHYHIEIQTKNDTTMVIRAFEYAFQKAKELSKYEYSNSNNDEIVIIIPKQIVIFIEQNNRIKDELKMKIIFPDGKEVKYKIPVMKYWEYTDNDLLKNKMYPLLPLQIFKLRYQMEQIKRNKIENKEQKQQEIIIKAKETAEIIAKEAEQLYNNKEINGEDYHKILLAIASIIEYVNTNYGDNQSLEEEE